MAPPWPGCSWVISFRFTLCSVWVRVSWPLNTLSGCASALNGSRLFSIRMTTLRNLPSVEQLLQTQIAAEMIAIHGRPLTLDALRRALGEIRSGFASGPADALPSNEEILNRAEAQLNTWTA